MYYIGKIILAFFNQLFRWLFWNKKGQKVLFTILIFLIAVCFIKLGEVSAVEEVSDINYEVKSYYDGVVNDAILRINTYLSQNPSSSLKTTLINGNFNFYFYYGDTSGSSYQNAHPVTNRYLNIAYYSKGSTGFGVTNDDYLGVTGQSIYVRNTGTTYGFRFDGTAQFSNFSLQQGNFYIPLFVMSYINQNWKDYVLYLSNDNTAAIAELLAEIKQDTNSINDALTNTDTTSTTDSFINVDSSAFDDVDSSNVDNVFSSIVTDWGNKFRYYDFSQDMYQYVINIKGTNIVLRSDLIYNMIKDTWFYPLLQLLWYYIFGHYAFAWLSNLIHKIKDGSILDGLNPHDVLTSEIL